MTDFEVLNPIIGGALIGLAASGMLWANGRVLGVSGILGGLFKPSSKDLPWRALFIMGLVLGSLIIPEIGFTIMEYQFDRSLIAAGVGGLLVGFGTTMGNGCTSGHGVCGISRMSPRSIAATAVFMVLGFVSVGLINALFGGSL
jgi:uncharacterized membrane protein YedE/YeeE